MNKPDFISNANWQLLKEKYPNNLSEIISKINSGYPIQYLIGNVEFLNTVIDVDDRVLIPRFETEGLVDKTIKYINKMFNKPVKIIDLGTGSGCIAIALKKNTNSKVMALDISNDALELAIKNAKKNDVEIEFINQDMLDELPDKYDIIISNPPYIPKSGFIEEKVSKYEPNLALFAQDNGIYFYKEILKRHLKNLTKPGLIAFEIGDNEKALLEELLLNYPNLNYNFENDLQGLPRYLFIFNE